MRTRAGLLTLLGLAFMLLVALGLLAQHALGSKPVPLGLQRVTAVHEAAHAVVGFATDPNFQLVRIEVATVLTAGQKTIGFNGHLKTRDPMTAASRRAEATMKFAGDVAEEALLGIPLVTYTDDQQEAWSVCNKTDSCFDEARLLAKKLVVDHGLAILRLSEMIMNQEPSGPNRTRRLDASVVREFIRKSGIRVGP